MMRAFVVTTWNLDTGEQVQSFKLRGSALNPSLDPKIFEMPAPRRSS